MSKYKRVITDEAKADVKNISDYIAKDNIIAAMGAVKMISKAFVMISDFPDCGAKKAI